ncbi:uncharacterized protein RJT20DRAFT_131752 [Scheffersomyces xylosifermentans]|uniref:uncharacterized protein n=1 Tax=Scheffersomyces xylosifermentans TaxID=1304137 RepID=UPI00315CA1DF
MNSGFSGWTNEKEDNGATNDEKFDPSFSRHDQEEGSEEYGSVDQATAVAAVATAQQHQQQQHEAGSESAEDRVEVSHADQVREAHEAVAVAAARLNEHQQQQYPVHTSAESDEAKKLASSSRISGLLAGTSAAGPEPIGSKFNRVVSGTKRAAQNRSAQRAFRQRKEKYIKDLEAKAAEADILKQTIEDMRTENLQLRDYTLALQSRVIELSPGSGHQLPGASDSSVVIPPPPPAVFNSSKVYRSEK